MKPIVKSTLIVSIVFLLTNCTSPGSETAQNNENAASGKTASEEISQEASQELSQEELVERGEYLVTIIGCGDCHSPKVMTPQGPAQDMDRFLSGHPADEQLPPISDPSAVQGYALMNMGLTAAVGPWGTSYATNLTPHETGLGNWSLENFETALRQGKEKGLENGRPLMPPMPWQNFAQMSSDDIRAIYTYLQTIPPIDNVVPAYTPPS